MYCMNLCHSKVIWKYYTGLMFFVGILAFVGWCLCRWNPTGLLIFGEWVLLDEGVWQDQKCHVSGVMYLIVPHLKMLSCPVLFQMSRCVPDMFLFIMMFLYCTSVYICYWLWCSCVADVLIFQFCSDYVYIMFSLRPEFCASIMWPPIYWWHCLWHFICIWMWHPIRPFRPKFIV